VRAASPGDDRDPKDCNSAARYRVFSLASVSSPTWRADVKTQLAEMLEPILAGPHANRFLGVVLEYLNTAEWYYPETNEFMDYSPVNQTAFREWLSREYRSERRLRSAWGRPEITFDSVVIPSPSQRNESGWGPFRDPVKHRPSADFQRFQADEVAGAISEFAHEVKDLTRGRSLVGAYYGYTLEVGGMGPRALAHSGHLALARLLDCPDVDMLHAPMSCFERGVGKTGHIDSPASSFALHGKLGFFEDDQYTHLSEPPAVGIIAPGWEDRTKTEGETLALQMRNFGICSSFGCGVWYFDLLSDGRWKFPAAWQTAARLRRILAELRETGIASPELAVVVDEESPNLLRADTWPVLVESLSKWRSELDRVGASTGYYLQSDLKRLPDSVRVIVMVNAFNLDSRAIKAIRKRVRAGATVIWTYAPGVWTENGVSTARIKDVTGFQVSVRDDAVPMTIKSALTDETFPMDEQSWKPRFVVEKGQGDTLATYAETGEILAAARPMRKGVSIYTATPRLPVGLLREICWRSGVHLYSSVPARVSVAGPYLFVHGTTGGWIGFGWPRSCARVMRVEPPSSMPMMLQKAQHAWTDVVPAGRTYIYRVDER
jgi:hypothetical protein